MSEQDNPWRVLPWILGGNHQSLRTVVENDQFYNWAYWTLIGARLQAQDPDTRAGLSWALQTMEALHFEYVARGKAHPGAKNRRKPHPRSGGRAVQLQ